MESLSSSQNSTLIEKYLGVQVTPERPGIDYYSYKSRGVEKEALQAIEFLQKDLASDHFDTALNANQCKMLSIVVSQLRGGTIDLSKLPESEQKLASMALKIANFATKKIEQESCVNKGEEKQKLARELETHVENVTTLETNSKQELTNSVTDFCKNKALGIAKNESECRAIECKILSNVCNILNGTLKGVETSDLSVLPDQERKIMRAAITVANSLQNTLKELYGRDTASLEGTKHEVANAAWEHCKSTFPKEMGQNQLQDMIPPELIAGKIAKVADGILHGTLSKKDASALDGLKAGEFVKLKRSEHKELARSVVVYKDAAGELQTIIKLHKKTVNGGVSPEADRVQIGIGAMNVVKGSFSVEDGKRSDFAHRKPIREGSSATDEQRITKNAIAQVRTNREAMNVFLPVAEGKTVDGEALSKGVGEVAPLAEGSLDKVQGKIDAKQGEKFSADILKGVRSLHDAGLAHRDLKPENILLLAGSAQIADLGTVVHPGNTQLYSQLPKHEDPMGPSLLTQVATPPYGPPELYDGEKAATVAASIDMNSPVDRKTVNQAADSWALGLILMGLLSQPGESTLLVRECTTRPNSAAHQIELFLVGMASLQGKEAFDEAFARLAANQYGGVVSNEDKQRIDDYAGDFKKFKENCLNRASDGEKAKVEERVNTIAACFSANPLERPSVDTLLATF